MAKKVWRTVRCVVELRTNDPQFSERDLCSIVQPGLDKAWADASLTSRLWAKGFNGMISRMKKRGPAQLRRVEQAALRTYNLIKDHRKSLVP